MMKIDSLKKLLKKLKIFIFVRGIYRKYLLLRKIRHPIQETKEVVSDNIIRLGSNYGGWSYIDEENLKNSTIISAGLGEDASFDVEFANKYNAKVIVLDPTPRAIVHFDKIINSLGNSSLLEYSKDGIQPIESYDLSNLTEENFVLIKKALWNKNDNIKFFKPAKANHVSHSIINYQNHYKIDTSYLYVEAITINSLIENLGLSFSDIPLIKLDIEGAEIEVITDFLMKGFMPRQILVEFDELNVPSKIGFKRISEVNEMLNHNNYRIIKNDNHANFLYLKDNL